MKYDYVVAGSGISGLTAAVLLAEGGRNKVLLLEKAGHLGGSLARFSKGGIPFDTGFHFTGALQEGELLHDMLTCLGVLDRLEPVFLDPDRAYNFHFEQEGQRYALPSGVENMRNRLKSYFPGDAGAVDRYFDRLHRVCEGTLAQDLTCMGKPMRLQEDDFVTLKTVLDDLTSNQLLRAVLCSWNVCYGTKPSEISFANHCRICMGLFQSVARIQGGGGALIDVFEQQLKELGVEVACGRHIAACEDVRDSQVGRLVLNNGDVIEPGTCVLAIHPRQVLDLLPPDQVSRAFAQRVSDFEPSIGFFTAFVVMDDTYTGTTHDRAIFCVFPSSDFEQLLSPKPGEDSALLIVQSMDEVKGRTVRVLHLMEPSLPSHVERWQSSRVLRRPADYKTYKDERVARMAERMRRFSPEVAKHMQVVDSASVLTYRDYLNSPDGSAYGVKQKMGQMSLIGRLPLRNLHVVGQSAMLPGLAGAMMSSFVVCRTILGRDTFDAFVAERIRR